MRRLRVQLTVLLALLGMLVVAWGAAIFLGARDAARSSASIQSTVDRVDALRQAVTGLGRDYVAVETTRRAYPATLEANLEAQVSATEGFERVRELSRPWRGLSPRVLEVAAEYRAWVRTGQTELAARRRGAGAAARVVAGGRADEHFQALLAHQTALEDQPARSQRAYARSQDLTYEAPQTLAVPTALGMLAALVLLAVWLRRAVGAPADALRSASGRLAGGDLETPVALGVENELGAVASDLETMRRRLGRPHGGAGAPAPPVRPGGRGDQPTVGPDLDRLQGAADPAHPHPRLRRAAGAARHAGGASAHLGGRDPHASRRLARLIDDLLSVSRMESGRLVLDPRPLDLAGVVERILSPFRAMATKHTLRTKLPGSLPVVWGDPDKVEQILTNLVGNAIKYSPGGGEVLVTVDHDGETVQVSVRDQGIGMSPRDMGQLFEKFYRVDRESVFRFTLPTSDELAGSGR